MKETVKDLSMLPLLRPDEEIEVEPGRPIPNGRVCFVMCGKKGNFRQVFKEGMYYWLKPLNSEWSYKTKFVHIEKAEIFVISEVSRELLYKRWKSNKD
jgi:hypothetical protein